MNHIHYKIPGVAGYVWLAIDSVYEDIQLFKRHIWNIFKVVVVIKTLGKFTLQFRVLPFFSIYSCMYNH